MGNCCLLKLRFHNCSNSSCSILLVIGHLEISSSAYRHQHCHWNWHWYPNCKIFLLPSGFFFEKAEQLCSFLRLVIVSVPLSHKYVFPIHPLNNVHWSSRKGLFELSETSVHWCFGKITVRNIYPYFPAKHTGWSTYSVNSQALPRLSQKSCLKQLLCRESASAWFSKKKCRSRHNLKNFPEF